MIDVPEKTAELLVALEAALRFAVALTPEVLATLAKGQSALVIEPVQMVSKVSCTGDVGGASVVSSRRAWNKRSSFR